MSNKESLTEKVNDANVASIRKQIYMKNGYDPYYGTINGAESVITDMDHFPYTRFYRGVHSSSDPVILEREAGWRPQRDACYSVNKCNQRSPYPNHCFQSGCSVTYPCYPQNTTRCEDKYTNNNCVVQYR